VAHDLFPSSGPVNAFPLMVRERAGKYRQALDAEVIRAAQELLERRIVGEVALDSPQAVKDYLSTRFGLLSREVFAVLHLNAQHRVLDCAELFQGTLTQTSVYPREVVKAALARNAAAVILVHNHPSGTTEPSRADEFLTQTLRTALALIDVRVVDHMIVGGSSVLSFAERGLM
jgi:DNA repair protein RadC